MKLIFNESKRVRCATPTPMRSQLPPGEGCYWSFYSELEPLYCELVAGKM